MIRFHELKRMFDLEPQVTTNRLCEELENGTIKPEDFSLRELAEASVADGAEWLRAIDHRRKSGRFRLQEDAVSSVSLANFSNVIGAAMYAKIKEPYRYADLIGDQLVDAWQDNHTTGARVPGATELGDKIEVVGENEEFPYLGVSEVYIDFGPMNKRGFIAGVTREAVVNDDLGLILRRCENGRKFMEINKEKRIIDVVTGIVNPYKRNGVSSNTYSLSGGYINQIGSNALVSWSNLEAAELLFDAITDPDTGEPILLDQGNLILLVPSALKRTAMRITRADMIRYGDGASNTTAAYTKVDKGLPGEGAGGVNNNYRVLSSPYVKARTSSASTWFAGDFKGAFVYRYAWGVESMQSSGAESEANFSRDILTRWKFTECGAAGVMEPRRATKSTSS